MHRAAYSAAAADDAIPLRRACAFASLWVLRRYSIRYVKGGRHARAIELASFEQADGLEDVRNEHDHPSLAQQRQVQQRLTCSSTSNRPRVFNGGLLEWHELGLTSRTQVGIWAVEHGLTAFTSLSS